MPLNKYFLCLLCFLFSVCQEVFAQSVNWTARQLMEPSELVKQLETKGASSAIISVGPAGLIPQTVSIGTMNDSVNVHKLRTKLSALDKTTQVVLYCGCCPFEHCPNVRPAIQILNEMGFTNWFLLNLPNNLKKDWIDKGYPVMKLQQ